MEHWVAESEVAAMVVRVAEEAEGVAAASVVAGEEPEVLAA